MSETLQPASARPGSRTWPQRLTIAGVFVLAFSTFLAAGVLFAGQRIIENRNIAPAILDPARPGAPAIAPAGTEPGDDDPGDDDPGDEVAAPATTVPETFPPTEPDARNFLITGADNNVCIDPDSPYAPAFGDRSSLGERSDTIMMWRVNPSTSQVAVLSFPRDLFVEIAGTSRSGRINESYERDNPQRLIDTIYRNFGIRTDHFVQVDFCAFQTLVDAVGGVAVPFATPVRDANTGLDVPEAGCFTFDGDHALAYVRSRYFQYQAADGRWKQDPTSDLGRISRQQDFLRRTVSRLLDKGAFNPDVASGLIKTLTQYVVTDENLTTSRMLEFAGVLSGVDPADITSYQIESTPRTIQGNAVLVPALGGANMQSILAVFRGEALLADIPAQVFETTVPPGGEQAPAPGGATPPAEPTPGTTVPSVVADETVVGVVPDKNVTC
jgi:LCP family protein required for cell wall assembly